MIYGPHEERTGVRVIASEAALRFCTSGAFIDVFTLYER